MKELLVIYYSQSGQLTEILNNIVRPIQDTESVNLTFHEIQPQTPYPFPWEEEKFYDTFPETFNQVPIPLKDPDPEIFNKQYDLIIFGYQIWFLTPAPPANSFLKSAAATKLMKNTPVITVIGCRNMWVMAHEKTKKLFMDLEVQYVGNIVLADRNLNHISVITIAHWLMGGKKTRYLGFFPMPGISQKDIDEAVKFGEPIRNALLKGNFTDLQQILLEEGAIHIKPFLITVDRRANVLFGKWANFIAKKGGPGETKRLKWVKLFKYYLFFAIWAIAPIVFILFLLTFLPMLSRIKKEKTYYSSVELNRIK